MLERENSKQALIAARQKRKLDEMYDQARSELESLKQLAVQPFNHFYSRSGSDLFSNPAAMMDSRSSTRKRNTLLFTTLAIDRKNNIYSRHVLSKNTS